MVGSCASSRGERHTFKVKYVGRTIYEVKQRHKRRNAQICPGNDREEDTIEEA